MIHIRHRKYPVFIVVDDGGFPCVTPENPVNPGEAITFDAYTNILKLAKEFKIRIPICFTMQYLDINNASGYGQPVSYAKELIDLLQKNHEYIEIGYHGLIHDHENHVGEFYLLDIHTPVPKEVQQEHIHKSSLIYGALGWDFPKLVVPPEHAWELGVTDRILAEYGVKYLVSHRNSMKRAGHPYKHDMSQNLTVLPRESLGIWSHDTYLPIDRLEDVKRWLVPRNIKHNLQFSRRLFNPKNIRNDLLFYSRLSNKPVHSYMAHIGNFMDRSYEFWREFFQYIKQSPRHELAKSSEDSIDRYFG